jgi:excisionase family DNA binding protein
MDELFTPEQVAERLQVTSKTVRDWLRAGELIGVKIGKNWRVHGDDIERLFNEQLFRARLAKAEKMHPNAQWVRGYCRECGKLMPELKERSHWVCSSQCQSAYDAKGAAVVGSGSPEFAEVCAAVVPPY